VLDALVQSRRDKAAAKRPLRKLLKRQARAPRVMVTDTLKSYGAAKRAIMPGVEHRQHKGLNNPRGEFAPADPKAGAAEEAVQITPAGSALPVHSRSDRQPLPFPSRPHFCR